jgi:hypothetical protein
MNAAREEKLRGPLKFDYLTRSAWPVAAGSFRRPESVEQANYYTPSQRPFQESWALALGLPLSIFVYSRGATSALLKKRTFPTS